MIANETSLSVRSIFIQQSQFAIAMGIRLVDVALRVNDDAHGMNKPMPRRHSRDRSSISGYLHDILSKHIKIAVGIHDRRALPIGQSLLAHLRLFSRMRHI